MSATMNETLALEVVFVESENGYDAEAMIRKEILAQNQAASEINVEAFTAFVELLAVADAEYIAAEDYVVETRPEVDWDMVSQALGESQAVLIGVQKLMSETLAAMGVEDHEFIRVYGEDDGSLRLVSDHERREEIEAELNRPENDDLRQLYHAAVSGMSLAGSLVGAVSVPSEVLERVKAKKQSAA